MVFHVGYFAKLTSGDGDRHIVLFADSKLEDTKISLEITDFHPVNHRLPIGLHTCFLNSAGLQFTTKIGEAVLSQLVNQGLLVRAHYFAHNWLVMSNIDLRDNPWLNWDILIRHI